MVATALVGAAVVGAAGTAYSASKAASAQKDAANQANQRLEAQYQQTREDLSPYRDIGEQGTNALSGRLDFLTSPIVMDQAALEQTPGYQFTRTQGLKAIQNSAAARGLGVSGAAFKGASDFATGLANKTYQDQFNLENANRTNAFNRLMSVSQLGQSAAAQTGNTGMSAAQGISSNTIGAGNAQAASYNAMGGAFANAANSVPAALYYQGIYGNSGSSGGSSGSYNWGR